MVEYAAKRSAARCPAHPGAILRDTVLPAVNVSKSEFAHLLGISRQHLYDIVNEKKPISPEVAVRLGKAFGDGPQPWLRMQAEYDAWHATRAVDVSAIRLIKAA